MRNAIQTRHIYRQWATETSTFKSNYYRFATVTLNFMGNELPNIVDLHTV